MFMLVGRSLSFDSVKKRMIFFFIWLMDILQVCIYKVLGTYFLDIWLEWLEKWPLLLLDYIPIPAFTMLQNNMHTYTHRFCKQRLISQGQCLYVSVCWSPLKSREFQSGTFSKQTHTLTLDIIVCTWSFFVALTKLTKLFIYKKLAPFWTGTLFSLEE